MNIFKYPINFITAYNEIVVNNFFFNPNFLSDHENNI